MKKNFSINYLLNKKINNEKLTKEEIFSFVDMSCSKQIKDYQISTMLTAIFFNGMSFDEVYWLTVAMKNSGFTLKTIPRTIDKHSTGGVGDKVTLIITPILACFNIPIFKMSGRGLGFTGGTIDKLESIGVNTALSIDEAKKIFKKNNMVIIEQSSNLTPADKIFYALRNDTETVMSLPLIVSSIMSKKLALGSKNIYLDVKVGTGALFKDIKAAEEFGKICIKIGKKEKVNVICHFTNMNKPLGNAIGNKIEIIESLNFLKGNYESKNLKELIYIMISDILIDFKKSKSYLESKTKIDKMIKSLEPYYKFIDWAHDQGSKLSKKDFDNLKLTPKHKIIINANTSGYFKIISSLIIGQAVFDLGGGRINKDFSIDNDAGILLLKENGDIVKKGTPIIEVYSNSEITDNILKNIKKSFMISSKKVKKEKMVLGEVR
ncbi:MAG: thymidine phosphorylase [Mycoplasmoidaceae bacterium]